MINPFDTLQSFSAGGAKHPLYSLPALGKAGLPVERLPVSIRLVLESLLRNCDGKRVAEPAVRALAGWRPKAERTEEIPFVVARIVLQDFTGVPLLVDLAAMRSAVAKLNRDPKLIEPLVPVDLVVDHSVQVDFSGSAEALKQNLEIEFTRNRERYQFLKWGMQAFSRPSRWFHPGIGIVHQVNLEYLAKRRPAGRERRLLSRLPSVGTDSHTTMINGLGGRRPGAWAESRAEAGCLLGQPVSFPRRRTWWGAHSPGALREVRDGDRPGVDQHPDAAQGQGGGKIRRVLWRGRRGAAGRRPRDDREHGARVRRHHGILSDRRRVFDLSARDGAQRGAYRLVRGLLPRAGPVGHPGEGGDRLFPGSRPRPGDGRPERRRAEAAAGPDRTAPDEGGICGGVFAADDGERIRQARGRNGRAGACLRQRTGVVSPGRRQPEAGFRRARCGLQYQSGNQPGNGQQPAHARCARRGGAAHRGRDRSRQRRDRGDHQLHQHLEPGASCSPPASSRRRRSSATGLAK